MEAWEALELTRCPHCHTRPIDWLDDHGWYHNPPKLEAIIDRCPGCGELDRVKDSFEASKPNSGDRAGVKFKIVRFDAGRVLFIPEISDTGPSPMAEFSLADPIGGADHLLYPRQA